MTNEWPPDVVDGRQLLLGIYCYIGRIKETDHLFRCHLFRSAEKFPWKTRALGVNIFGHLLFYFLPLCRHEQYTFCGAGGDIILLYSGWLQRPPPQDHQKIKML